MGMRLDSRRKRPVESRLVGGIDIGGERHRLRRADLDEIQHCRALAASRNRGKLVEMLRAARRFGIGKFGAARRAHHVHVLHFEIAGRQSIAFEQEIEWAIRAKFNPPWPVAHATFEATHGDNNPNWRDGWRGDDETNRIGTQLADLSARTQALRGYL